MKKLKRGDKIKFLTDVSRHKKGDIIIITYYYDDFAGGRYRYKNSSPNVVFPVRWIKDGMAKIIKCSVIL